MYLAYSILVYNDTILIYSWLSKRLCIRSTRACICIKYISCICCYIENPYLQLLTDKILLNLLFQIFKRTSFIVLNPNPLNSTHTGKFILFALELDCQGQMVMRGNIYSSIKPFTNRLTLYPCSTLNSQ